jgi:L-rhamnose isomerase/sugar isomerase
VIDPAAVKSALSSQVIETPSWGYGNSGTRFKVFAQAGVPRDPFEKLADAARVHAATGVAPLVSLHIPWDRVEDYDKLAEHAHSLGVRIGAINSNTFQDEDYKLGSVAHPDPRVRRKAVDHLLECVDIMDATGSRDLKLWFADGTSYPGQDDIVARQDRLAEAQSEVYARLGESRRMVLVDLDALRAAQAAGDVLGANAVLMDAYNTDVRPLLAELRTEMGLDPDPLGAYRASGWQDQIVAERVGGHQAGWGA